MGQVVGDIGRALDESPYASGIVAARILLGRIVRLAGHGYREPALLHPRQDVLSLGSYLGRLGLANRLGHALGRRLNVGRELRNGRSDETMRASSGMPNRHLAE